MSPLKVAFFTTFIDLLGFGIIIPIQPFYAESFGASAAIITALGAVYSLMQFLFSGMLGRLSDRVGRRPVLLITVSLVCVGYLLFARATSIAGLFLARAICGIGGANIGAAQAIIADVTPPDQRSKGMGLIGVAFGLGFIFGPAIGGFLGQWGPTYPIYAAAALSALNWVFIFTKLPETRVEASDPQAGDGEVDKEASHHGLSDFKRYLSFTNLFELFGVAFFFTLAFALMEQTIGLLIEKVWVDGALQKEIMHREAARLTAYFLVSVGVGAAIVQGGLIGRLTTRFGEVSLCRMGVALVTLTFALIPVIGGRSLPFSAMMLVGLVMAAGTGMLHPSRSALLSQAVPAQLQGGALGASHSLSALGRVFGPACAGLLFEQGIYLPLYVGAGIMCVALLMTLRLKPLT